MGFVPFGRADGFDGFINSPQMIRANPGSAVAAPASFNLPTELLDGDDVWVVAVTSAGSPTTFGTPTGWTLVGSQKDGGAIWGGMMAIFRKTWHNGDATTVVFPTIPGTMFATTFIVRSESAHSIVQDVEGNGVAASLTCQAWNPSQVGDLRLGFCAADASMGSSNFVYPAVTPNDNNWTGKTPYPCSQMSGTKGAFMMDCVWSDPGAGLDGTNGLIGIGGGAPGTTKWYFRQITITDGTTYNGLDAVIIEPLIADPAVTAASISADSLDELSAASGVFGGGAHIL